MDEVEGKGRVPDDGWWMLGEVKAQVKVKVEVEDGVPDDG